VPRPQGASRSGAPDAHTGYRRALRAGTARFGSARADRIAYTVAEVAALLGKHINTVYGWVRSGALPSERIGNTIYIPKWALARLQAPPPEGDEAA
jgi:excisionase family DNA binding protein